MAAGQGLASAQFMYGDCLLEGIGACRRHPVDIYRRKEHLVHRNAQR